VTIPKTIVINSKRVMMQGYFEEQNKRDNVVKRLLMTSDKQRQILNP